MEDFPEFMKSPANAISSQSQSKGVRGWMYEGIDGKQMTYWICEEDGHADEHSHNFDEYFAVVEGCFILIINGEKIPLKKGDEYYIKKGIAHSGEFIAGTRTIHCFAGKRASLASPGIKELKNGGGY